MRNLLLAVGLLGVVGAWTGCGGSERPPAIDDGRSGQTGMIPGGNKGGSKMDGPVGGEGGGGGGGEDVDPLAPLVTISSPLGLEDPNEPGVLTGAEVTVVCEVKQSEVTGSAKVDPTSVKLALLDADGAVVTEKNGAPTAFADEYAYTFSVTTAPAGRIRFRCTGQDTAKRVGTDRVATFLDKGPLITFIKPDPDSFAPLTSLLTIDFTVEPAPLADGDEGAAVDEVHLEMGGVSIPLEEAESAPGVFHLAVNLADPTLFDPAPNGLFPLIVTASNQRMPTAVESTLKQNVSVDGAAPIIQITSPSNNKVVGGNVVLTFKATDAVSGIDPASVVVSLNDIEDHYDPASDAWGYANGTFTYEFDSTQAKNSLVQITANVRASDKVGNASAVVTVILYRDNFPPSVDLDPDLIRTVSMANVCSHAFDPVGDRSLNDLDNVHSAGRLRAIVWENTNSIPEIQISYFSGVAQNSVRTYVRPGTGDPLLINTDNDPECDDVSEVDDNAAITLGPVAKGGTPWPTMGEDGLSPTMASLGCANADPQTPSVGNEPVALCNGQSPDMYQVIEHPLAKVPVVYGNTVTAGPSCTGSDWEFTPFLDEDGWACLAARAVDNAGNVGISRPIRVCVDNPSVDGSPTCAISSTVPPSCTDGCTPPPRWGGDAVLWL